MSTISPGGWESTQFGSPKVLHKLVSTFIQASSDDGVCGINWTALPDLTDDEPYFSYASLPLCGVAGLLSPFFITGDGWASIGSTGIVTGFRIQFLQRSQYTDGIYTPYPTIGPVVTLWMPIKNGSYSDWEVLGELSPDSGEILFPILPDAPDDVVLGGPEQDWDADTMYGRPITGDDLRELVPSPPLAPVWRQAVFMAQCESPSDAEGEIRFGEVVLETYWYSAPPEQFIYPTGIDAGGVGTPIVNRDEFIYPFGIYQGTVNAPQVIPGVRRLFQVGVGYAGAVGTPTVVTGLIEPESIQSGEQLGFPSVQLIISPTGIDENEFGLPHLATPIFTSGIVSAIEFGALELRLVPRILVSGIPSAETFGHVGINTQTVEPLSIDTEEIFGLPQLNHLVYVDQLVNLSCINDVGTPSVVNSISPESFDAETAFGLVTLVSRYRILVVPISAGRFGIPKIGPPPQEITVTTISTGETIGTPVVTSNYNIQPTAISEFVITEPELEQVSLIRPPTLNNENFGTPRIRPVVAIVGFNETAFGFPSLTPGFIQASIQSWVNASTFGTIQVAANINIAVPTVSTGTMGTPRVGRYLQASGIAASSAVGSPAVVPGPVVIGVYSLINAACYE